jgi:hypothetical protein
MVLIDGVGRSGTSLLGRLASILVEPAGFTYFYEPFQHSTRAGTFAGWREMIGRVLAPGDRDPELEDYIDSMRRAAAAPLLWKEIRLVLKQDWLLARWPELKIIHITRDILGVWSSHRRAEAPEWMARHRKLWCAAAQSWVKHAVKIRAKGIEIPPQAATLESDDETSWYAAMWTMNEMLTAKIANENFHRLRYEDLCLDPVGVMTSASVFLGVPMSDQQSKSIREHAADALRERDPSGVASATPDKMPEIWRERLNADEIAKIVGIAGAVRASLNYPAVEVRAESRRA